MIARVIVDSQMFILSFGGEWVGPNTEVNNYEFLEINETQREKGRLKTVEDTIEMLEGSNELVKVWEVIKEIAPRWVKCESVFLDYVNRYYSSISLKIKEPKESKPQR